MQHRATSICGRGPADADTNRIGGKSWKEYIKRPTLLCEIADLRVPAVLINGSEDIRPNWPTVQLAGLMPLGRYVEISGAAHTIWLTHADELKDMPGLSTDPRVFQIRLCLDDADLYEMRRRRFRVNITRTSHDRRAVLEPYRA